VFKNEKIEYFDMYMNFWSARNGQRDTVFEVTARCGEIGASSLNRALGDVHEAALYSDLQGSSKLERVLKTVARDLFALHVEPLIRYRILLDLITGKRETISRERTWNFFRALRYNLK